jgi:hypothetical protein
MWLLFSRWNESEGREVFILLAHEGFRANTNCIVYDTTTTSAATRDSLSSSNLCFLIMHLSVSNKP